MPKSNLEDGETVLLVEAESEEQSDSMAKITSKAILAVLLALCLRGFKRFWGLCTTCLLSLLLLHWLYGGLVSVSLILVGIIGES